METSFSSLSSRHSDLSKNTESRQFQNKTFDDDFNEEERDQSDSNEEIIETNIINNQNENKDNKILTPVEERKTDIKNELENVNKSSISPSITEDDLQKVRQYKDEGNQKYRDQLYMESINLYTQAIDFFPITQPNYPPPPPSINHSDDNKENISSSKPTKNESTTSSLPYADDISILYGNRAACYYNQNEYQKSIDDCSISLRYNPRYVKVLIRRANSNEKLNKYVESLNDWKSLFDISKSPPPVIDDNLLKTIQQHITYLTPMAQQQEEKMKTEMMGQLKDLGNKFLGMFGMSLDNFKAQQDPNTGSYSISMSK